MSNNKIEKPIVKQFVANWYEKYKEDFEYNVWDWIKYKDETEKMENLEFIKWLHSCNYDPIETLVKMKLYGYEVKKDKKYIVKFKGINDDQCYLNCINNNDKTKEWILYDELEYPNIVTKHTRKELKESGFEWVFDCPGVEIIEVVE